jgi:hypothetical protein
MPFDGVEVVYRDQLQRIDAVIDLLATPDRWCKGALKSHDGRHCIRGAVRALDADALEPVILRAIGEVAGPRFRRIESFNDHPQTSHEQVLTVLRRARTHVAAGSGGNGANPHADATGAPALTVWRAALHRWFRG